MLKYKDGKENFLKKSGQVRLNNQICVLETNDDLKKISLLYESLSNPGQENDIIDLFININELIYKCNFSFANGFPIQQILDIAFDIFQDEEGNVGFNSFETILLILRNSCFKEDDEFEQYYYEREFHQLLYDISTFSTDEYHPNIILESIALYSSTSIEARDSILELFSFDFFQQFIQARNTECIKSVISCFNSFLKYPLAVHILSSIYDQLSEMSCIEDDGISFEILNCISQSMNQEDWENLFIDNKLHNFVKYMIEIGDQDFKDLSIEILKAYSVDFSLIQISKEPILDFIISLFLCEQPPESEKFCISVAKIFTNHIRRSRIHEIEFLLKQGMILVLIDFFDYGSYSLKLAGLETVIELIKCGDLNQKILFLEENLMKNVFDVIQSNEINVTVDVLDALLIEFDAACGAGFDVISMFVQQLTDCDGFDFLNDLSCTENEEIKEKAKQLLDEISNNYCFD